MASRIAGFATEVLRVYELGYAEMSNASPPWTLAFQQDAIDIYLETLPIEYLRDLAADFDACAALMSCERPVAVEKEWGIVGDYLANSAEAIVNHPQSANRAPHLAAPASIEPSTPSLMRFGLYAERSCRRHVLDLHEAASAVQKYCERGVPELTDDEVLWLNALVSDVTISELANQFGWSRRTMCRKLDGLWKKMSVSGREHGLVEAGRLGLIQADSHR